ncbi:MAG: pyridoxamine 5'-phosphate oxidase family protein [Chloroflexi bacterium]|nr:pyridoxamine 5'-phosphate oxidase family protein [Chloroflexota bacterium]
MEDSNVTKTRQIIASNRYLSLATCRSNEVWVAPVAYVVDADYNFYFCSAIDSIHIQHLKSNLRVAFAIFDSTLSSDDADGVQILALAGQVEDADLSRVMDLYWKLLFPDPQARAKWALPAEHFRGDSIQRFFQLSPIEIYKLDTTLIEVDRRVQINLKDLKRKPVSAILSNG